MLSLDDSVYPTQRATMIILSELTVQQCLNELPSTSIVYVHNSNFESYIAVHKSRVEQLLQMMDPLKKTKSTLEVDNSDKEMRILYFQ